MAPCDLDAGRVPRTLVITRILLFVQAALTIVSGADLLLTVLVSSAIPGGVGAGAAFFVAFALVVFALAFVIGYLAAVLPRASRVQMSLLLVVLVIIALQAAFSAGTSSSPLLGLAGVAVPIACIFGVAQLWKDRRLIPLAPPAPSGARSPP